MVDPVRNSPNMAGLAVNDQKKSSVSSGQENSETTIGAIKAEKSSVSLDLSLRRKLAR